VSYPKSTDRRRTSITDDWNGIHVIVREKTLTHMMNETGNQGGTQ
jgi:hypothetical protein